MSETQVHGSDAFLQQARRNNWQRYLESLPARAPGRQPVFRGARTPRGWNLCILTASDRTQASMMERQLAWRRRQGLLPESTRFFVVADPDGRRIGSGGATLRLLSALYPSSVQPDPDGVPSDLAALRAAAAPEQSVLVIHSGGDSRRLPHCSAIGKLFARIPHVLPDGRASTIFDEMLINLSGVVAGSPPGVLVLSGDVLLVFDHLQLSFQRHGVTGVAVAAPQALGQRHGVYVTANEHKSVAAFLHKASVGELAQWGAVDDDSHVQIDTGLVWFDVPTAARLAALTAEPSVAAFADAAINGPGINLYGDLLLPLAQSTDLEAYLGDESDGPATAELKTARRTIWSHLHGTQFTVERLQPAVFVHFGTSEEYWRMVTSDEALAHLCGWSRQVASWVGADRAAASRDLVLINSAVGTDHLAKGHGDDNDKSVSGRPALISDSQLPALTWEGRAIVAGLRSGQEIDLRRDVILHQLPVEDGYVTRVVGLNDDPKHLWQDARASYLNQPWAAWLARASIPPDSLWPHVPAGHWNLWHARLFPLAADREESLELALPLQDPGQAPEGWQERWLRSRRLSLAEGFALADGQRILDDISAVEDHVAAKRAAEAIRAERPATEAVRILETADADARARRYRLLEDWIADQDEDVRWRGLSALTAATADSRYEDEAFAGLAHIIERDVAARYHDHGRSSFTPGMARIADAVRVEAAARIDFGGGWTDTPPFSVERGGCVLNAAVSLRGKLPIVAEASWLDERELILESRDINEVIRPERTAELLDHRNPADPFALAKAALVLKGIVPAGTPPDTGIADLLAGLPGGIRLTTQTAIPRGSGLGTSSIMAGAVLACLDELAGYRAEQAQLFDQVLCLEQMMTTGGGWQDQVGGLTGGAKLVTSRPGLPQAVHVEALPAHTIAQLQQRLVLVYTGQQRLAKNLLRAIMARWMARDPQMVRTLEEIGQLALRMTLALEQDDVDEFGSLVGEHWLQNRRMDPGCTNPFIDDLFDFLNPFVAGAKLAGAGGGGFAIVITRAGVDQERIEFELRRRYAGAPVAVWPSDIAERGLVYV